MVHAATRPGVLGFGLRELRKLKRFSIGICQDVKVRKCLSACEKLQVVFGDPKLKVC